MLEHLRLQANFNAQDLARDLDQVSPDAWIAHFNTACYEGDWSGTALRGPAHATHPIQSLFATPGTEDWADTPLAEQCPAFRAVMDHFHCPLRSVRLLRLAPGAIIKEHTDHALGLEDGEVRLHVPIRTNPSVSFHLNGMRIPLNPGELWYLNVNLPHSVTNEGATPRIHIVLDCVVNQWLRDLFRRSEESTPHVARMPATPPDTPSGTAGPPQ